MDLNQELPRPYKNSAGKILGEITRIHTLGSDGRQWHNLTVNLTGLGEWTISELDDIDDDRLKAIAEYKKVCIEGGIEELNDEIAERKKEIEKLMERLESIDNVLKTIGEDTQCQK